VQVAGFRAVAQSGERIALQLLDSGSGDAEGAGDLLERVRLVVAEPEAQLQYVALSLREGRQDPP